MSLGDLNPRGNFRVPTTVVCGPPGSGKTTFVRSRSQRGDLILDMDVLYQAFSGLIFRDKPNELLPFVTAARDAVFDRLQRPSRISHAWLTTTLGARREERDRWQAMGGEVVLLAVPMDECLRRVASEGDNYFREEGVREWWSRYEP